MRNPTPIGAVKIFPARADNSYRGSPIAFYVLCGSQQLITLMIPLLALAAAMLFLSLREGKPVDSS